MKYKYLFGPVISRRLGISLGIDIVPSKVCNLNCVYCECGTTTNITNERKEYVSPIDILNELGDFFSTPKSIDIITITASGEPTLNTGLLEIISGIKTNFPAYKTALLTNGTLLYIKEVREAALLFDYVLPSLDAVSDQIFTSVNHPHTSLHNDTIIQGIVDFAHAFKGILWLEIFIVPGVNDSQKELLLLKNAALSIHPTRVQLNTLDRPGTKKTLLPASSQRLAEIAEFFSPLAVEIISRQYQTKAQITIDTKIEDAILSTIKRRPSTLEDLASATNRNINDIAQILENLCATGLLSKKTVQKRIFYRY